jgi:hypothetical protein
VLLDTTSVPVWVPIPCVRTACGYAGQILVCRPPLAWFLVVPCSGARRATVIQQHVPDRVPIPRVRTACGYAGRILVCRAPVGLDLCKTVASRATGYNKRASLGANPLHTNRKAPKGFQLTPGEFWCAAPPLACIFVVRGLAVLPKYNNSLNVSRDTPDGVRDERLLFVASRHSMI